MAKGRIRVVSAIPGPANLSALVSEFCKKPGVVTAFDDAAVKSLASMIPADREVEPIQFGGLARRFLSLCGELPLPISLEGHAVAAIGLACQGISAGSPFWRTAGRQGLHESIVATLHELSGHGLSPDDYDRIAAVVDPALGAKLDSLAGLEREATETLRQLGRSFSREHYRLCAQSEPEKNAELGRVFVLAGAEFKPQSILLIQWAAAHGAQITVAVYRPAGDADLFHGSERTLAALGIEPELVGRSNRLLRNLFANPPSDSGDQIGSDLPAPSCSIVSAADPLAEVEWALRGCLDRHRKGLAFDEVALYVRDSESYSPLIEASARRLGVPIRMARRVPLMTNSFARTVQAMLEFCASSDVRTLMRVAQTSYLELDYESRQALQTALKEAHSARPERWNHLRSWVSGQSDPFSWLARLLDWRDDALANPCPLEAWIIRLRDLMLILPAEGGPVATRERDRRAGYVLHQSLNQIATVRRFQGPRTATLSEFLREAAKVWAEADVSIPGGEHGVLVASRSESLPQVRCLFVLGMLEGVFPRRRTEDPILSDFDRSAMSDALGSGPLPNSRDRSAAERDEFYVVCAAASEEVVLSYPETDEERDNVPAFYLDEVERALGTRDRKELRREELTPPLEHCLAESDKALRRALGSVERSEPIPTGFTNAVTADRFRDSPDSGVSPQDLRDALQCPFSLFARRKLDLRPDRLRAKWFALIRLPGRASLSSQKSEDDARHTLHTALDQQLDEMYSDIQDWETALLRSGGRRLIEEWIAREFSARKIWPKDELRQGVVFGEGALRSSMPRIPRLTGSVAATSRCGPYTVVHLVESAGPARSLGPANELADRDKLYYGIHLLAAWPKESAAALEIETMSEERLLVILPRLPSVNLTARVQAGLRVIDLAGSESGGVRTFFEEVKKLAQEAAARIETVDVRAIKGDHCAWCDYGELCRQSLEFGEEDSPFVEDI